MEIGDKVIMPRRLHPIGEIIAEIPKDKPSDKRLFTVKYTNHEGRDSICDCWIDELKPSKNN